MNYTQNLILIQIKATINLSVVVVGPSRSDRYPVAVASMACLDHVLTFMIQHEELIRSNPERGLYLDVQLNM